ncbi:MAG: hypothetical protein V2J65_01545 [Desulfobacteraceae bacterium]|jgi:hypothetical protein|nr:hypothetical protein [Desulfobacteraceae bacterium]
MTTMVKTANQRYRTLCTALAIIDPDGMLVPGTQEHNWFTETILSWMAEKEPEEVFQMSEDARYFFKPERRIWQ